MRADRHQRPPSADVMMQPVLQVEEGIVRPLVQTYIPEHRTEHIRPDGARRQLDVHLEARRRAAQRVLGRLRHTGEDGERTLQPFEAQNVITVRWDLNLIDDFLSPAGLPARLGPLMKKQKVTSGRAREGASDAGET